MAFDKPIAVITIFCEASSEPMDGKIAVAATFFNRVKAGRFGSTIAAVCLRRMQYSEWDADPVDNANLMRAAQCGDNDAAMLECGDAYDRAAGGEDPTGGCTHYFKVGSPTPSWAEGKTPKIVIGAHGFYENIA